MHRFKNILFVCDEHSAHEQAQDRVCALAAANAASVTLVGTIDCGGANDLSSLFTAVPGLQPKEIEQSVLDVHRAKLGERAEALRQQGIAVEEKLLTGTPFIEIIREVLRNGHDLVIKGAHRSGGLSFFPGADMHLLRKCPCPVWILNAAAQPTSRRILAAVDPDPADPARDALNHTILELATSLARQDGARLDVINAWRLHEEATLRNGLAGIPPEDINRLVEQRKVESEGRLRQLMAGFADFDDMMRVLHIKGTAADVIPEHVAAEGIDTIVMGTLARTGVGGLFIGNTAETILNHVTCSVLAVKAEGFVSPVELDPVEGVS